MITIPTKARIAGSVLCSWGAGGDWANGCENVALPGKDLCPPHKKISDYLEAAAAIFVESGCNEDCDHPWPACVDH